MDRRAFLGVLGLLAVPRAAEAQPAGKVPRIGYLASNLKAGDPRPREAFLQGLVVSISLYGAPRQAEHGRTQIGSRPEHMRRIGKMCSGCWTIVGRARQ